MSIEKPLYDSQPQTDDYLDLMLDDRELIDIKKSLEVGPLVKLKKDKLNNLILKSATQKIIDGNSGLPRALLAREDKPPTLEDYLQLGVAIGNSSESEREMVLDMLNKTLFRPTDKK